MQDDRGTCMAQCDDEAGLSRCASPKTLLVPNDLLDGRELAAAVSGGPCDTRPSALPLTTLPFAVEGPDLVEVTEGLIEGDTVAVTGAYLLYAEFALKKGGDPMAGHSH